MEQEHLLILELIHEGKITVPEALDLIEAVDESEAEYEDRSYDNQTLTIQLNLN